MSSISSSRKARPNTARDSDYVTVTGDFRSVIDEDRVRRGLPKTILTPFDYWKGRQRRTDEIDADAPDEFVLRIQNLAGDEVSVTLDGDYRVPPGTKIPRTSPMVLSYELNCPADYHRIIAHSWIRFGGDGSVDISALPALTQDEIRAALKEYDHSLPAPPEPSPLPSFRRSPRVRGDSASRLGFSVGGGTEAIDLPGSWAYYVFHLPRAIYVGRVATTVDWNSDLKQVVRVKLFNAFGELVLETALEGGDAVFDDLRIEEGDYVICYSGSGVRGTGGGGANRFPYGTVPMHVKLDELPRSVFDHLNPTPGMPRFTFSAD